MAEALIRSGVTKEVRRRGRIFYEASAVNGFRLRNKRTFAGLDNTDLEVLLDHSSIEFNPWAIDYYEYVDE